LAEAQAPVGGEERKVVTVLFADPVGLHRPRRGARSRGCPRALLARRRGCRMRVLGQRRLICLGSRNPS